MSLESGVARTVRVPWGSIIIMGLYRYCISLTDTWELMISALVQLCSYPQFYPPRDRLLFHWLYPIFHRAYQKFAGVSDPLLLTDTAIVSRDQTLDELESLVT